MKQVCDILPETEILAQLAEEAAELAQAALKLRRALDGTNPTPRTEAECREALWEEFADVTVCAAELPIGDEWGERIAYLMNMKRKRWMERLEGKTWS